MKSATLVMCEFIALILVGVVWVGVWVSIA